MPRGDRTGPNGMGPRTGRGAGFCSGYDRPGYMNGGAGTGFGYGRGIGRGYGRGMHTGFGRGMGYGRGAGYSPAYGVAPYGGYGAPAPYSKDVERSYLEDEISLLKEQLKASESRLADLSEESE